MRTTKGEFLKAYPRSILSCSLRAANAWPDDIPIQVFSGAYEVGNITSNLYKALKRSEHKQFVIGGRHEQGYWFAVA